MHGRLPSRGQLGSSASMSTAMGLAVGQLCYLTRTIKLTKGSCANADLILSVYAGSIT